MGTRTIGVRNKMPFETTQAVKNLSEYFEQAKVHLVETVDSYRIAFGKSFVDQKLLMPKEYQDLVWFLFPSEITSDLVALKRGASFEVLEALGDECQQNEPFNTPF